MIERWNGSPGEAVKVWSIPLADDQASFRPRLQDGIVLASGRGFLSAHAFEDGRLLWQKVPRGEEFSVPLLADGKVFVGDGFALRAMDARTGQDIWESVTDPAIRIHYGPASLAGVVYLCPGDGVLYAFEAASGKRLWTVDKSEQWQYLRQLHFWNDVLVAGGYHDEIYGLDAKDGRALWRFVAGNFVNSHMVYGKGVYFWSPTGWIYKLNPADGLVKWRHRTVDYITKQDWNWAPLMAELAAHGGSLFCLDMKHVLHLLDIESGEETQRLSLPPVRAFVVPEPQGGGVWLGDMNGDLLQVATEN